MVVGLWKVGSHCFPQVLAMIRDLESDSGFKPEPPMDGKGARFGLSPLEKIVRCQADSIVTKNVPRKNATHFHQVALLLRPTPNGRHQCSKLLFGHQMEEILHRCCCLELHLTVPSCWQEPFFQRRMKDVDWMQKKVIVNCLLLDNYSGQWRLMTPYPPC